MLRTGNRCALADFDFEGYALRNVHPTAAIGREVTRCSFHHNSLILYSGARSNVGTSGNVHAFGLVVNYIRVNRSDVQRGVCRYRGARILVGCVGINLIDKLRGVYGIRRDNRGNLLGRNRFSAFHQSRSYNSVIFLVLDCNYPHFHRHIHFYRAHIDVVFADSYLACGDLFLLG